MFNSCKRTKLLLQEVEQKLEQLEKHQLILNALSPTEKQELGQLSKVLKMYVQPETLADKRAIKVLKRRRRHLNVLRSCLKRNLTVCSSNTILRLIRVRGRHLKA